MSFDGFDHSPLGPGEIERLRAIAEHSRDVLSEIDQQGRLLWTSRSHEQMFGWEPGEVLGQNVFDLMHPDDRPVAQAERVEAMRQRRVTQLVFRYRHKDGRWLWIELVGTPYETADGELRAVLVSRDVTARVEAERALGEQRSVEMRISELSVRLLRVGVDEFAAGVGEALAEAADIAGADRVQLLDVDLEGTRINRYYQWAAEGVPRHDAKNRLVAMRRHGWARELAMGGNILHIPDCSELPPEAVNERETMRSEGVLSYLAIPLQVDDDSIGFLDFATLRRPHHWTDQELSRLRLLGEVFASALRRHRADAARRASELRFQAIAEHVDDCICVMTPSGEIEYMSPRAREITGYSVGELAELDMSTLVHPEDRDQAYALGRRGAGPVSYRVRSRGGEWIWLEASSRRFKSEAGEDRIALVIRETTKAQEKRLELERQLELEQAIARLSRDLLTHGADDVDAGIQHALEGAAAIAGADRAYLIAGADDAAGGRRAFDWHAPDVSPRALTYGFEEPQMQRWILDQLLEGEVVRVTSLAEIPESGAPVRTSLEGHGVRSLLVIPVRAQERLIGVLGFHCLREERRWTEHQLALLHLVAELFTGALRRRSAEQNLEQSQHQLLQAQKMEAVGTLAGGIAHDFNNQLTVMLGNARYALRHVDDAEVAHALTDVERAAEHCAQLTRSLLAFSRRTAVKPTIVDLSEAISEIHELLRPLLPSSIELLVERSDRAERVRADPVQLQQVMINLAVNARDAMPNGGQLRIATRRRDLDLGDAQQLGLEKPGNYVEISVEDHGTGIDESIQARIFEPFFTTKGPGGGSGLGLATAYGIVKECGGSIAVESRPAVGSTFRVLLPRSSAPVGSGDVDAQTRDEVQRTVLLVENEERVRRFASRTLTAAGFRVIGVANGREALDVLGETGRDVDLLLTDVDMPRMGGVELAQRLSESRQIPVVFVSGTPPTDSSQDAGCVARTHFIQKPFDAETLVSTLRGILGRDDGPSSRPRPGRPEPSELP